jgi:hypothetical protein
MLFLHEQENAKITENRLDLEQSIYNGFADIHIKPRQQCTLH